MRLGLFWGLCFALTWVVTDWLLRSVIEHGEVDAQVLLTSLGVSAPFALLLALFCGVALGGWQRSGWWQALRAWWTAAGPDRAARFAAALTLGGIAAALALATGSAAIAHIRTPQLAIVAVLGLVVACAAFALAALPALGLWFEHLVTWRKTKPAHQGSTSPPSEPEHAKRTFRLTMGRVVVAGGAVVSAAVAAALVARWQVASKLPWTVVAGPAVAGLLATLLALRTRADALRQRAVRMLATLWAVACGAAALLPLPRGLLSDGYTARYAYWSVTALLDFDGDGASNLFGGGDCAPFDAQRGPDAIEIAGNGVDEDCSGHDLAFELAPVTGSSHHERPDGVGKRPHIVLITTDSLSYRHTGIGGYERDVTPYLDAFAARATVFDHAFANSPATETSFPELFTGVPASVVPTLHNRFFPDQTPYSWPATLAGTLQAAGYATRAVVGSSYFSSRYWAGIGHGFDTVDFDSVAASKRAGRPLGHTAPEVTASAIEQVRRPQDRPLFLWVHYFDHHDNYDLPSGQASFGPRDVDRFDAELAYADRHWGKLITAVEQAWLPGEYVLLFTADHGEVFDAEHRHEHHRHCLRSEEVSVPFVVQTSRQRGVHIGGLVSHLDVTPTLLDMAGVAAPRQLAGESLVPALYDGKAPDKTVVFSVFYDPTQPDPFRQIAVRTPEWHFIDDRRASRQSLYAWPRDPEERDPQDDAEVAEGLRQLTKRKLAELREHHRRSPLSREGR